MNSHTESMKKADRKPVLFPHWFHRVRFKCKVCHESIFLMKKGANEITMPNIINRQFCGKCHDGNIAFSPKECDRCHSYDKEKAIAKRIVAAEKKEDPAQKPAMHPIYASKWEGTDQDGKRFVTAPMRLDETFDKKAFKKLEKDKFGLVDWAKAVRQGKVAPISQIGVKIIEDKIILRKQVIQTKSEKVNDVLFSHGIHTYWLSCSNCHDKIFPKGKPLSAEMKMIDFAKGKWCGTCHGKVSFHLGDCKRCHTVEKEKSTLAVTGNK